MSLAKLSTKVNFDPAYIGRVERGDQFPSKALIQACEQVLDAGGELTRLWRIADSARDTNRGHKAKPNVHEANPAPHEANSGLKLDSVPIDDAPSELGGVTVPCRTSDGRITWVTVPRRTFLLGGLAAAGGLTIRPDLQRAARLAATGGGNGLSPVEHLQRMRQVLIDSDNLLGPRHIIPTVYEHIKVIQELRAGRRGADGRNLLHLQAEYAEFLGWLYQDSGDLRHAQYWLDRAQDWSHAVGDSEMAVYVMARKSQLAGDRYDPQTAIDLANVAAAMAQPGSRIYASAHTYRAYGHALAGEPSACLNALDDARDVASSQRGDQGTGWAVWLDGAYVDVQRGRCLSAMGDHGRAAAVFQQAMQDLPAPYRRDRGVYLAREAHAHAGAQDPDQAAAAGMQALAIAEETGSGRIINELAELDGALQHWSRVPAVSDFRSALTAVIPQETVR
jgi:tetratricopeptide (TPR) repeat protein